MQKGKQLGLVALLLASLWLGVAFSWGQGALQQTQHLDASALEHIRQLTASLPPDSYWRSLLEHEVTGDGIRQPWMDHMRKESVKLAIFTYDFVWIRESAKVTDWTLVGTQYFRDYDEAQQVTDREQLALIRRDGLEKELEALALPRAKTGHWVDSRPETGALGYHSVYLADDEWLPVTSRSRFIGFLSSRSYPADESSSLLGDTERIEKMLSQAPTLTRLAAMVPRP